MTFIQPSESCASLSSPSSLRLVSECSQTVPASFPTSSQHGSDNLEPPADREFATALKAYEQLLRQALAAGSQVVSLATKVQADRGLDPLAGHQIYHAFSSANLDISSALSHAARGHRQVDLLAHALGIDVSGYGKNHPMPGPNFTGADATDRAVAC